MRHNAIIVQVSPELKKHLEKLSPNVVDGASMRLGLEGAEPLIVGLECFLRYAKAYEKRMGDKLAADHTLGVWWLESIVSFRKLLAGDGAVAMEQDISTDSKSNGVLEGLFWDAIAAAGIQDADVESKL